MVKVETSLQFETGGVVYGWTGEYRIPTFMDKGNVCWLDVPPDMIFESEDGVRIGVHRDRIFGDPTSLIAGDGKPSPEDPKPLPKPPKGGRR